MDRQEKVRKILEAVKKNECSVGRATHQICSLFEPGTNQEYHLTCMICNNPFWSIEAFPEPQICPACDATIKLNPEKGEMP